LNYPTLEDITVCTASTMHIPFTGHIENEQLTVSLVECEAQASYCWWRDLTIFLFNGRVF